MEKHGSYKKKKSKVILARNFKHQCILSAVVKVLLQSQHQKAKRKFWKLGDGSCDLWTVGWGPLIYSIDIYYGKGKHIWPYDFIIKSHIK